MIQRRRAEYRRYRAQRAGKHGLVARQCQQARVGEAAGDGLAARRQLVELRGHRAGFQRHESRRDGDVVVVTVNHRLNVFGYLYLGDQDPRFADSANAGIFDVVACLSWIRDNIAAFGGDPGNVTVFGQSGGAAKVAALMDFPAAHGLFHKAVIESCSGGLHLESREEAGNSASFGHAPRHRGSRPGQAAGRAHAATDRGDEDDERPVPSRRGRPWFHAASIRSGRARAVVGMPLLIGNAATEMTLYMAADPRNFSLDLTEVKKRTGLLLKQNPASAARIVDAYRATLPDASPSDVLAALSTDYVFRRNTTRIAALQSAQAPVYDYVFDWKTPVMDGDLQFAAYGRSAVRVRHGERCGRLDRQRPGARGFVARGHGRLDGVCADRQPEHRRDARLGAV